MKPAIPATLLALASSAFAHITPYETTFSAKASLTGWSSPQAAQGARIQWTASRADFDAGDTLPGDGALALAAGDAVPGNEYFTYPLTGKLETGETLTLAGTAFNAGKSHTGAFYAELVRADGKRLARSKNLGSGPTDNGSAKPVPFTITHTATEADAGSGVEIRFTEAWNSVSRVGCIDHLKLTSDAAPNAGGPPGIAPYHTTFSAKKDLAGWTVAAPAQISIGAHRQDGTAGDGVAGDGGLVMRAGDNVPGNEFFTRPLTGTLCKDQTLTVTGAAFNPANSHNASCRLELVRADGKVLATSNSLGGAPTGDAVPPVDFRLSYTATAEDHGQGASLRFAEKWNATVRILVIDNLDLTATAIP